MSPRTPKDNERIREERREEILQAAAKVFSYKGYAATKIADIAAAAEVSHGLVYHYFQSKEEIYQVLAERIGQGPASIAAILDMPGGPREKVLNALRIMLRSVLAMPEYFVLAAQILTAEGVSPLAAEQVFRSGSASQQAMAKVIAEGQACGEFRAGDPMQLFSLLYAMIQGLAISQTFAAHMQQPRVTVDAEIVLRLIEP